MLTWGGTGVSLPGVYFGEGNRARGVQYMLILIMALKHHQIDPSLPPMQRAVNTLHKYTLTDCLHPQLATLPIGHTVERTRVSIDL